MRADRVLLSAIIFSVVWHLFWISALKVVIVPKDVKPLKFSSVSFLGPILDQGMLKVSVASHERLEPEKRYLSDIKSLYGGIGQKPHQGDRAEANVDVETALENDEIITALAVSAIEGDKIEPGAF